VAARARLPRGKHCRKQLAQIMLIFYCRGKHPALSVFLLEEKINIQP
jgi:hypothetical protein